MKVSLKRAYPCGDKDLDAVEEEDFPNPLF
jgi:hypothetical protein